MPYKNIPITKKYYTVGEVADMFKVFASKIRFYCDKFDIVPRRKVNNDRLFTHDQIEMLEKIMHLKRIGFTLPAIKKHLHNHWVLSGNIMIMRLTPQPASKQKGGAI